MTKTSKPGQGADAERAKPKPGQAEAKSHLVPMRQGDEEIAVHPTCVAAHRARGWIEA